MRPWIFTININISIKIPGTRRTNFFGLGVPTGQYTVHSILYTVFWGSNVEKGPEVFAYTTAASFFYRYLSI